MFHYKIREHVGDILCSLPLMTVLTEDKNSMCDSREGREQYDYEITQKIYGRLGSFGEDYKNEELIRNGKMSYSFQNTMYGTLGPERTVWDEEAKEAMKECIRKKEKF